MFRKKNNYLFLLLLISAVLITSCKQSNPEEQLKHINGYWEIQEVEMTDGTVKEYSISMLVDFIEITGKEGFRKKAAPRLDGTFEVTEDSEKIDVEINNDEILLHHSTPYYERTETVLTLNENKLVLLNPDGKKYVYKRYEQINWDE